MSNISSHNLFNTLVRQLKRFRFSFSEKQTSTVDEYVLEHFLLYHALVGTSPDNQPEFKDVRNDILTAIDQRSCQQLCIALKLQPLWWDDKLKSILAEVQDVSRAAIIACLLPEYTNGQLTEQVDPLKHEDWRVRANAAQLLAFMKVPQALPRMKLSLEAASAGDGKPAFCHIAYAIALLQTEEARQILLPYLYDDEPWFRVDAARALSLWTLPMVAFDLTKAMLTRHTLSDYMAVTIARHHAAKDFLLHHDPSVQQGALEIIIGCLQASTQTYTASVVEETSSQACWPLLLERLKNNIDPRSISATLALVDWLQNNAKIPEAQLVEARNLIASQSVKDSLLLSLKQIKPSAVHINGEDYHTIKLLGQLQIKDAVPFLSTLLTPDFIWINEVIDTISKLEDINVVPTLISLVNQLVDLDSRCMRAPSKYPVVEIEPERARTYWHILCALSSLPSHDAVSFLFKACGDYASDQRQQALESLIQLGKNNFFTPLERDKVKTIIANCLQDPSTSVKLAALDGVARLDLSELISQIIKLTNSKESSLSRQAFQTLDYMSQHGHLNQVSTKIEARIKSEFDPVKREILSSFLQNLR